MAWGFGQQDGHVGICGGGEPFEAVMDQGPRGRPSDVVEMVGEGVVSGEKVASVSVLRTSEPPGRSVIHWPLVQAMAGSREVRRVRAERRTCSVSLLTLLAVGFVRRRVRRAAVPSCIAAGQVTPPLEGDQRKVLRC